MVFGIRGCDVKGLEVLDKVFLSEPQDSFYCARRKHGIIVSLACGQPEESCFCKVFGIDCAEPEGDVVTWLTAEYLYWKPVTEKGEAEFNRQRLFMREMNHLMKKTNKVLILVSHTNKSGGKDAPGMSHIIGSSAIAQVSTKVIEIGISKDGTRFIHMWKSRFSPHRRDDLAVKLNADMRFEALHGDDPKVIKELRRHWGK